VCFVDDDELVQQSHIRNVVEHLEANSKLDGVGGPYQAFSRPRVRTCRRCRPGEADFPGTGLRRVDWLFGGNMALRRAIFETRGLFDEELTGFQEWEWFRRGQTLALLYDPDLWVWHRRDQQGLFDLCKAAWVQGMALRVAGAKLGRRESASVLRLLRYLGHGVVRLCGEGVVLASREGGALQGAWTMKRPHP
jgi:hypothetical protein